MSPAIEKFRYYLKTGRVCLGASITLNDPLVSEALGDSVDFFWIDLEHGLMSPEALNGHLLASRAKNVPALVRVTGSDIPFIKPALDSGADGIIVPQVRSVEDVKKAVDACRYPPSGHRGYGPRVPSNYGRAGGREYIRLANESIFVAVQIETAEALESIDDIVSVTGLDSVVIGPWDLSGALGVLGEVEHPRVAAAIDSIISKARKAGLAVGAGMGPDADYAYKMARRGVQWIQVGGDFNYMIVCMDQLVASISGRLGQRREDRKKIGY